MISFFTSPHSQMKLQSTCNGDESVKSQNTYEAGKLKEAVNQFKHVERNPLT